MADFTKRVLIVEDDGMLMAVLVDKISYYYSVEDAIDGEQAWNKLTSHRYDLILLDLMIPMVNGYELLERIRTSENPDLAQTPVVIISNLGSTESVDRAKAFGVSEYFIKSNVKIESVVNKIRTILEPHAVIL